MRMHVPRAACTRCSVLSRDQLDSMKPTISAQARLMNSCVHSDGNGLALRRGSRRLPLNGAMGAALGAAMLFACPLALAEEIRISSGDCTSAVHLVARDAHFSDVLKRLAQALDFQLSFESDSDPLVNVDAVLQPADFVARLAPYENISTIQAHDPRCPHQTRILKLWVLSKGDGTPSRPAVPPTQALPVHETAEQARQAQEGIDMYLKSHGLDPGAQKSPSR